MSKGVSQFAQLLARLKFGLGEELEFTDTSGRRVSTRRFNIFAVRETNKADEVNIQIGTEIVTVQATYAEVLAKWVMPPLDG